ncbi:MAG: hypothetical protein GX330_03825 [Bacteroidales bacterium]|nr:hypothetical protein [Bacteroidales bacterium]
MSKTPKRELAIDTEKVELFISKVIRKNILPNAILESSFAMGAMHVKKFKHASVGSLTTFENYRESNYCYEGTYKFIHYTNVQNLTSIIREKKIRLYDLRGMDDKDEFDFGYTKVLKKDPLQNLIELKKHVFCLSMCKYELENKEQSLNMWRQFGGDGHGVGIVLKFSKQNRYKWVNYILSQMYYGESCLEPLHNTYEKYKEFSKKNDFIVRNFEHLLCKLFCCHKQHIYKNEKEVRLIYSKDFSVYPLDNVKTDLNNKAIATSYHELELEWDKWKQYPDKYKKRGKTVYPQVTIDKIVFGYRISDEMKENIIKTLGAYRKNYRSFPTFEDSPLRKYFQ